MKRNTIVYFMFAFLLSFNLSMADDFSLKLKGKVESRSWKLTSGAYKQEIFLKDASVELYKESTLISKTISDKDGNFEISIPSSGNYILLITYPGYDPKKFIVNTKSVPVKPGDANFIPSVDMTSFIAPKTIKGAGDLGLNQPVIRAERTEPKTGYSSLNLTVNINDAEYRVIQKFCTCNKLGDMALNDKNYSLAKTYYSMAADIMPGEAYPKERIKKAEEGSKIEKSASTNFKASKGSKGKGISKSAKPSITAKPTTSADFKNSSNSGKATRKIPQKLGK